MWVCLTEKFTVLTPLFLGGRRNSLQKLRSWGLEFAPILMQIVFCSVSTEGTCWLLPRLWVSYIQILRPVEISSSSVIRIQSLPRALVATRTQNNQNTLRKTDANVSGGFTLQNSVLDVGSNTLKSVSLDLLKSTTLQLNERFSLNQRKEIKFSWKFHHQKFLHHISVFWHLQNGKYSSVLFGHLHCTVSAFCVGLRWWVKNIISSSTEKYFLVFKNERQTLKITFVSIVLI